MSMSDSIFFGIAAVLFGVLMMLPHSGAEKRSLVLKSVHHERPLLKNDHQFDRFRKPIR